MFKKILFRSLAGATAVGSALAVSLVATPVTTTAAPEIRTVACANYPGSVPASINVSVRPAMGAYGTSATATAKVTSGSGTPQGSVKFWLINPNGSVRDTWVRGLHGGAASVGLPRWLGRGTYKVLGRYRPGCTRWQGDSDTAYYTVQKAPTSTRVGAPDVKRGTRARVNVTVRSSTGTPSGRVRISVIRSGKVLASATRSLDRGHAFARFGTYRVGSYTAKAVYLGTHNWKRSSDTDDFRVTRR